MNKTIKYNGVIIKPKTNKALMDFILASIENGFYTNIEIDFK